MLRASTLAFVALGIGAGLALADPSGDNIIINEIYVDSYGYYDGAEFIELYNPTGQTIDIGGWVLSGPEYGQVCGGEDRWQFPGSIEVPPGGFIVVAKDGCDGDDGFLEEFGVYPDFEMFDDSFEHDRQCTFVEDMILLDPDPATYYSDEIGLVGGTGYGVKCGAYSEADVVYLYNSPADTGLVDLVEYMNPEECSADPCPGDDGADDNAFQGIPRLGNSLGRSPESVDTDNSIVDFSVQAPTPAEANVENMPPLIEDVYYSPIPPNNSEEISISATVTDDGDLDSLKVYFNVDGTGWETVQMGEVGGDGYYVGRIPVQSNGAQVEYFVRAVDTMGAGMNYPAEGFNDPFAFSVGYTDIYDVQFVESGHDTSQLLGRAVNVQGRVTAGEGTFSYDNIYIHEGTGAFKGVKVYIPEVEFEVKEGDHITACGTVSEYYNETEIYLHFPDAFAVHSSGNPLYEFTDVTTAQVAPDNVDAERYEGQLVRIQNAIVTGEPDEYGEWMVSDASATEAKIGDYAYYSYHPKLIDTMAELRGICTYSYNEYKTEPRSDDDIIGPPRIGDVVYRPAPPVSTSEVTVSADLSDNVGIVSATLYYSEDPGGTFIPEPMTQPGRDMYEATIGPFEDGTSIYYYVECSDGTMTARKPVEGSYSFYVGLIDIYDVQYVPSGGNASPYDGDAVNVQGVVTAAPGDYSDYYFCIQDGAGEWNGVKVYDRTGTIADSLNLRDEVIICGTVQENFDETEIAMHFPEAYELVSEESDIPATTVLANTNVLQTVDDGEPYEGVLVQVFDAVVADPNLGFDLWAITNAGPTDTCRVGHDAEYEYEPVLDDEIIIVGVVSYAHGTYRIEPRGDRDIAVNPVGIPGNEARSRFGLFQNTPNPFNPSTTIAFSLAEESDVVLDVFDVAGRRVRCLVSKKLGAGSHRVVWNGRSDSGEKVASGVYFYKLRAGKNDTNKRMVLLK